MSESDPLRNADIGHSETVRRSVEIHPVEFEPDVYYGSDRMGRSEIVDIERFEDEYGDTQLRVIFEGELTKQLPRNWDYARQPRTDREGLEQAQQKRFAAVKSVVGLLIGFGISVGVLVAGFSAFQGQFGMQEISNEAPTLGGVELVVLILLAVLAVGILPHLPRPATGGRRR